MRQGVGSAETNHHAQMGAPQLNADSKSTTSGRVSGSSGIGVPASTKQLPTSKPPAPPANQTTGSGADTATGKAYTIISLSSRFYNLHDGVMEVCSM